MPNHVYSSLELKGNQEQIESFINGSIEGEAFDFTLHFPTPSELEVVGSPVHIVSEEAYLEAKNSDQPYRTFPITQQMHDEYVARYGFADWYTWNNHNWSTKWGCYNIRRFNDTFFLYQTAWSPATNLWLNISKKFPDVEFITEFVDEGDGFIGTERYKNGRIVSGANIDPSSAMARIIKESVGVEFFEEENEVENRNTFTHGL